MNKQGILGWIARFYLRYNRGNSLFNFVKDVIMVLGMLSMIVIVVKEYLGMDVPVWIIFIMPFLPIFLYALGWLDEKYGFWKIEAVYATEEINPYFKEMSDNIKEIKAILNGNTHRRRSNKPTG